MAWICLSKWVNKNEIWRLNFALQSFHCFPYYLQYQHCKDWTSEKYILLIIKKSDLSVKTGPIKRLRLKLQGSYNLIQLSLFIWVDAEYLTNPQWLSSRSLSSDHYHQNFLIKLSKLLRFISRILLILSKPLNQFWWYREKTCYYRMYPGITSVLIFLFLDKEILYVAWKLYRGIKNHICDSN